VWARKAEAAGYGPDWMIRALEVELLVGAGRVDEAKAMLPSDDAPTEEFYVAAALARVANVEGRLDVAAKHYMRAAELARVHQANKLVAWAEAMAAGMLVDARNFEAALPHLEQAKAFGGCAEEVVHRAELLASTGKPREALATYDTYLAKTPDPAVHHAAWKVASALGDTAAMRKHYEAAAAAYRKVIDAGEVYTLGGLAQLILDTHGDAREALTLAEQNFKYKRDVEATKTLTQAREQVAQKVR
jgi:tetratricopeptide (TPR) repeat protein